MELKCVYICGLVGFSLTFTLVISFTSLTLVKQKTKPWVAQIINPSPKETVHVSK